MLVNVVMDKLIILYPGARLATVRNGPLNVFILATVANGRSPYWIG